MCDTALIWNIVKNSNVISTKAITKPVRSARNRDRDRDRDRDRLESIIYLMSPSR
jgi:hypothetical protein